MAGWMVGLVVPSTFLLSPWTATQRPGRMTKFAKAHCLQRRLFNISVARLGVKQNGRTVEGFWDRLRGDPSP